MPLKLAMPRASVLALATGLPWQSDTCTVAPATGLPVSSVVTQATELSRPSLKCTPRLVTNAEVRTTIVRCAPYLSFSSDWPSRCEAISST